MSYIKTNVGIGLLKGCGNFLSAAGTLMMGVMTLCAGVGMVAGAGVGLITIGSLGMATVSSAAAFATANVATTAVSVLAGSLFGAGAGLGFGKVLEKVKKHSGKLAEGLKNENKRGQSIQLASRGVTFGALFALTGLGIMNLSDHIEKRTEDKKVEDTKSDKNDTSSLNGQNQGVNKNNNQDTQHLENDADAGNNAAHDDQSVFNVVSFDGYALSKSFTNHAVDGMHSDAKVTSNNTEYDTVVRQAPGNLHI